ncbi:MAG: hypothetical protein BGO01_08210 [Armatimonadetes bacterium 55-13]|nr:GntR family transcriptional regulator [Armatimonadota bacterium]OJU62455.1 MAG: hypothetical protein BGO01_08210 [Armatimonadetes bacterium 55-13]
MSEARWKNITAALESQILAGELNPGDRLPSEDDIAVTYGVSRPTAHRALRELQAKGLVTRQRRWGTVVAERSIVKTKRIGFIVDIVDESYGFPQPGLLRGIQAGLSDEYSLVLCDSQNDPLREAELLWKMSEETDGIVLLPTSARENTPLLNRIIARGFPLVMLDRVPEGVSAPVALSDNYIITRQAIKAMIDQGHDRVAFLSFHKPHVSTVQERFKAYEDALIADGLPIAEDRIRFLSADLEHSPDRRFGLAVQDAVRSMLVYGDHPATAIFCVQDMFVPIVLDVCDKVGKSVPEDIAIATFNDGPPMILRKPWAIHRITPRVFEIGRTAGDVLRRAMSGEGNKPEIHQVHADLCPAEGEIIANGRLSASSQ